MTKQEIIKFLILRTIGNFLVLFAVFGVFATFGPALYYEALFRVMQARGVEFAVAETPPVSETPQASTAVYEGNAFSAILSSSKEHVLVPTDTDFTVLIPKIGANAKVIANVDPSDEKEFQPALQHGVAHAKGSVFPGMKGNTYLFAHSTDNFWNVGRYNALFYLLKDLQKGDEVVVFFENVRHNYTVSDTLIVDPSEVSYLTKSQEAGDEAVVLQTCWPPGTTWKRLLVIAKPQ